MDLCGLTGRGVKVAVVDSGIDLLHPKVGRVEPGIDLSLDPSGAVAHSVALTDRSGHGTACAGLIRRLAPEATVCGVRILDASLEADGRLLEAAIRWSAAAGMDIVNLSLGTTEEALRAPLHAACRQAVAAGVILVAAAHADGRASYPAVFPEVIGVRGAPVRGATAYHYHPGETFECTARGDAQRLCWRDGSEVVLAGTSYAAARISGIVALIRQWLPGAGLDQVRAELADHALSVGPAERGAEPNAKIADPRPDWIRRAALFPYAKETHALVRFRHCLDFEIAGVADPVGKGLIGRDAGEVIGAGPAGLRIGSSVPEACTDADTLVLGHLHRLGQVTHRDLLRDIVTQALDLGKNVFSLGPVDADRYGDLHERARQAGLELHYPQVPLAEAVGTVALARSLPEVNAPVLGVFGTSASQGKFTVQLALRYRLRRLGYRVGQIGTEPHAGLFGMDVVFPMGYESPLDLPLQLYAPYLDAAARALCARTQPDLVLAGCQSGTVPYELSEPRTHSLPSLAFLLGVKPDACILVVNSIDPDAYVQDTLDALRSVGRAPVILLAMGDQAKEPRTVWGRPWLGSRTMDDAEIGTHLRRLEERFGLPAVAILSEEGQERMVATVLRHFATEEEECRTQGR